MIAFFFLYVTEGIPLGFAATAIATQMRRQGVGVADIGAFVGAIYLPWAWKWAIGPFVDVLSSDRYGRRRAGFWAGGGPIQYPVFYSYAYPVPEGFGESPVSPDGAVFNKNLGEFLLPYDLVREASDPDRLLGSCRPRMRRPPPWADGTVRASSGQQAIGPHARIERVSR